VGRVGLEPTTGGLWEVCPRASCALPARIPRSRAAGDADCTVGTDGSVHEPVHASPWRSWAASYRTLPSAGV